jgi:3-deoxy-manno-octulosonate cytidylyltransferase (CMP-KDO synthetase)
MSDCIIVIPARKASTRLSEKVIAPIGDKLMIQHVIDRANQTSIKDIIVACDDEQYAKIVKDYGAQAIMTDPNLPSGTDRARAACEIYDPQKKFEYVICLQGDVPFINPQSVDLACDLIRDTDFDITTLAANIPDYMDPGNPNIVKVALSEQSGRALYFSRSAIPYGLEPKLYHIGVYIYRRKCLDKFVSLSPSKLEIAERLEQLRAMEAGMSIGVKMVEDIPISVDTYEDLEKAREYYLKHFSAS